MLKLPYDCNISHASKVMHKILQARLQQYVNRELPDVQDGFRKCRGTRDQIANIRWIIKKARESLKNIYFYFIDYTKAFDCGSQQTVENSSIDGTTNHLTCLLRNLYAGQEATVWTGPEQQTRSKLGKEWHKLYIVTLFIYLLSRVHHVKCWSVWSTSWNQGCQE